MTTVSATASLPATASAAAPPRNAGAGLSGAADQSSNWAGYVVTNRAPVFTSATATWKQPKVVCTPADPDSAASFWVGIGGAGAATQQLDQVGTESDCGASGTPRYYAWYEIVPGPIVVVELKVLPGDTITTSLNILGNGTAALFQIKNRTRKTVVTDEVPLTSPPDLSSAEWIAEAPSGCSQAGCVSLPLANFKSITFSRIAALGNGYGGTLTSVPWTAIPLQLVPLVIESPAGGAAGSRSTASTAGAITGRPTADGRSFAITWEVIPGVR